MKNVITSAAEITVLEPIDNNYKTGGGPVSVGGCAIVAAKGNPFEVYEVFGVGTSQEDIFGKPLPKKAYGMEGLRHLAEAAKECNWVQTVRVVNSQEYMYPSMSFLIQKYVGEYTPGEVYLEGLVVSYNGKKYISMDATSGAPMEVPGEWAEYNGPVETDAHRYNEKVLVGDDGLFMVLYVIDGDASTKRTVRIEDVDTEKKRFYLAFYDIDETGYEYLLERHLVGVDEDEGVFHILCKFLSG